MIGGDFKALGRDEEENVVILSEDLDVGFIASGDVIDGALVIEIETVAVKGGCGGVVQNCLVRNLNVEDIPQNSCGLSGWNCKRDVESQDKAKDILGVMDFRKIDGRVFRG